MNEDYYFPSGIATGNAFCNRLEERKLLKTHYNQNAHVVLMSPRRYGKTSLIHQFTLDQKAPFITIDLLPATSEIYVRNAIFSGATALLNKILPRAKKAKQQILNLFTQLNPTIELSAFGQRIKLTPMAKTPQEDIMHVLLNLDKAALALNTRLIFVMNEFQQIATLLDNHTLEASIRHAVERSQKVFYIFSGSNRTILEEMFKDEKRPLYHLCDELKITRIHYDNYAAFITHAAKQNWRKKLPDAQIKLILDLTECHSYYVNRLCRLIWHQKTDFISKIYFNKGSTTR